MIKRISSKAEEYLAHAQECEAAAETASQPDVKKSFKEAARQWREMAKQADRYSL